MLTTVLDSARGFPLCVEDSSLGLVDFVGEHREWLADRIAEHGAVLLRGFGPPGPDVFAAAVAAMRGELLDYVHGNSPRSKVGANVYTSTEYPAEFDIPLHNELSYASRWPSLLFFHCVVAPATGGRTPLADSREILRRVPARVRDRFTAKGVLYVQRMHGGVGLGRSWQDTYETSDRAVVEEHLRSFGVDFSWTPKGALHTRQLRPATVTHPSLEEEVWFNQADQWHWSGAGPGLGEELRDLLGEDSLPSSCTYGDGASLDLADLAAIRQAGWDSSVGFDWVPGDLLILDNVRLAHSRTAYTGSRRILLAMT